MKNKLLKFHCIAIIFTFIFTESVIAQTAARKPLDMVFCVDLSGSTNGLINNVRDNIWLIVNQANKMIPTPDLRIAVIGFSRPSFGKNNGYVKVLSDLTRNFDVLEAELYKLKPSIEKGDQFVSAALATCMTQINWSKRMDAFKVIYLCGNGMIQANNNDCLKYCEHADEKNIIVNILYIPIGGNMMKELPAWRRIATITHGMQSEISVSNKDNLIVFPDAEYDRVREINNKFNNSFLWTGNDSSVCRKSLNTADSGAFFTAKDMLYNRVYYKTTQDYSQILKDCDLINAYTIGSAAITDSSIKTSTAAREFSNHFIAMKEERNKLVNSLKTALPDKFIDEYKSHYTTEFFPENNIFQRAVLTMLFKQYEKK